MNITEELYDNLRPIYIHPETYNLIVLEIGLSFSLAFTGMFYYENIFKD